MHYFCTIFFLIMMKLHLFKFLNMAENKYHAHVMYLLSRIHLQDSAIGGGNHPLHLFQMAEDVVGVDSLKPLGERKWPEGCRCKKAGAVAAWTRATFFK